MEKVKSIAKGFRESLACFFLGWLGITVRKNALREDVVLVTRQLSDHLISFYPHDFLGKHLYVHGEWARDSFSMVIEILLREELLGTKKTVLELGANIGTQTIYFHLTDRFSQVVAVEADPNNGKVLRLNLEQNKMMEKSILVDCAISQQTGKIKLFLSKKNTGGHSLLKLGPNNKSLEVNAKTLNKILDDNHIKPDDIGFCWVDLEGYEPEAMGQIVETIGAETPVFTEFSPEFYGEEKSLEFLQFIKAHYSYCYIFDKDKVSEKKITQEISIPLSQVDFLLVP